MFYVSGFNTNVIDGSPLRRSDNNYSFQIQEYQSSNDDVFHRVIWFPLVIVGQNGQEKSPSDKLCFYFVLFQRYCQYVGKVIRLKALLSVAVVLIKTVVHRQFVITGRDKIINVHSVYLIQDDSLT